MAVGFSLTAKSNRYNKTPFVTEINLVCFRAVACSCKFYDCVLLFSRPSSTMNDLAIIFECCSVLYIRLLLADVSLKSALIDFSISLLNSFETKLHAFSRKR